MTNSNVSMETGDPRFLWLFNLRGFRQPILSLFPRHEVTPSSSRSSWNTRTSCSYNWGQIKGGGCMLLHRWSRLNTPHLHHRRLQTRTEGSHYQHKWTQTGSAGRLVKSSLAPPRPPSGPGQISMSASRLADPPTATNEPGPGGGAAAGTTKTSKKLIYSFNFQINTKNS